MADQDNWLRVGRFVLHKWKDDGPSTIWIQIASGRTAGEGGEFKESELEAVIAKFYAEHF